MNTSQSRLPFRELMGYRWDTTQTCCQRQPTRRTFATVIGFAGLPGGSAILLRARTLANKTRLCGVLHGIRHGLQSEHHESKALLQLSSSLEGPHTTFPPHKFSSQERKTVHQNGIGSRSFPSNPEKAREEPYILGTLLLALSLPMQ